MDYEKLVSQTVKLSRDGSLTKIVAVTGSDFPSVRLTFENGRAFLLSIAMSKGAITFSCADLQKALMEESEAYQKQQADYQADIAAKQAEAIERAKAKIALEPEKKKAKKRGRK